MYNRLWRYCFQYSVNDYTLYRATKFSTTRTSRHKDPSVFFKTISSKLMVLCVVVLNLLHDILDWHGNMTGLSEEHIIFTADWKKVRRFPVPSVIMTTAANVHDSELTFLTYWHHRGEWTRLASCNEWFCRPAGHDLSRIHSRAGRVWRPWKCQTNITYYSDGMSGGSVNNMAVSVN